MSIRLTLRLFHEAISTAEVMQHWNSLEEGTKTRQIPSKAVLKLPDSSLKCYQQQHFAHIPVLVWKAYVGSVHPKLRGLPTL